jgi:triosephosphate isomerase
MRKSYVAGNWKMHGSTAMVQALVTDLSRTLEHQLNLNCEVIIFPPAVYIDAALRLAANSPLMVGAQDVSQYQQGAYTGEISATMLADVGCRYALVGHSERRQYHQESNELTAAKVQACIEAGIQPVLCVGETLQQWEQGLSKQVVAQQIDAIAHHGMHLLSAMMIAYEPVWAIGTGKTATPEYAQEIHAHIRAHIGLQTEKIADNMCILYGGSVKSASAEALFAMPDIDGGLVGGASLDAQEFIKICQAVTN